MNRASSEWFRLALLLLTASSVFGQDTLLAMRRFNVPLRSGTYSTRRDGDRLIVFEVSGNVSSEDDGQLDLQDALNEALGNGTSTLVFELDEYEFRTRLVIPRSLNVTSGLPDSTKAQLRCSEPTQMFRIEKRGRSQEDISVELQNVRISNCTTRDPEGIVHVGSGTRVVFEDVELLNNRAEGINHAIVAADSNATLEVKRSSSFSNNHGRVILVGSGSQVTIDNSTFLHNTAETNGTVLATKPAGWIQLIVRGSRFEGNAAEGSSGGVMSLETSNVTIKNGVQFISNVASNDGGALYLTECLGLHITDARFENNSCSLGKGGAILLSSSSASPTQVRRSVFKENSANGVMGVGGAIAFGNSLTSLQQVLQLGEDVLFVKNTARATAGAVFVNGTDAAIECSASFVQNTAQGEGGALYITSLFYSRRETEDRAGFVREASFISNSAPLRGGGALVVRGGAEFLIADSTFTSNMAAVGGAIFAYDDVRVSITDYTLFRNNRATRNGGSIILYNGRNMTLRRCHFENNRAGIFGGGLHVVTTASFSSISSGFTRNHAGQGGAINVENSEISRGQDTKTTLEDVVFTDNWSLEENSNEGYGGAVRLTGAGMDTIVERCLFENNTARWGGSLYLAEAYRTTFVNTNFSRSTARLGGALYIVPLERELHGTYDSTNFKSCFLGENMAARGGAIFARPARLNSWQISEVSNSLLSIENSVFLANRANDAGGGLFLALMNASFIGCSFQYNRANRVDSESTASSQVALRSSDGGAVWASDGSYLTVSDTNFIANSASRRGGAVCIDDALFSCTRSCSFRRNRGRYGGGAFCSLSSEKYESNQPSLLHCNDCAFERNNAQKGGGIYASFSRTNSDAQQFQACQGFSGSDRNTIRTSPATEGSDYLIFFNPQRMQYNSANETGSAVFSTQPCAIMVSSWNGNMNLVQYFNTTMNEESSNYAFASPARTVRKNDSSLKNMNRGNTSEEMSRLDIRIFDYFGQRVENSRIVVELRACLDGQNCCGNFGQTDGSFTFDGEEKRFIDHGMVNFANLSISNGLGGSPAQRLWVCFEDEGEEQAQVDPVSIDVSFRECYKMELNDSTTGGCRECPPEQYFDNKSNSCKPCPSQATCRGLAIIPDAGFWHATSVSHRIHKCHPREACVKDKERKREQAATQAHERNITLNWTDLEYNECNTGYEGILCGSCKEDHGRWNDVCRECLGIPLMWIALFVSVGWIYLFFLCSYTVLEV